MYWFGFRNFGALGFLHQIDKPRLLVPVLRPFAAYFRERGLRIEELENSDAHDQLLLSIFTAGGASMPRELVELLSLLDDLADEAGHDRILAEVERNEIPLRGILGEDLSPGEFALAVYARYPSLVRDAHQQLPQVTSLYEEFPALRDTPITLAAANARLAPLQGLLGHWFQSKNRSDACFIAVSASDEDVSFSITHGRPYRMISAIDRGRSQRMIGFRPQQRDTIIYSRIGNTLQVNAHTASEREVYRRAFGTAFFANEDHFERTELYNLRSLQRAGAALTLVPGLEAGKLVEVRQRLDDEQGSVQVTFGHDLLAPSSPLSGRSLARGRLISACFTLSAVGGASHRLELRPPNFAICERGLDPATTRAFLVANELLKKGLS